MADQASVSRNERKSDPASRLTPEAAARGLVGNIAEFGNDVMTLAELQAKLAMIELKESTGRAVIPAGIVVVAAVLALSSVPVALIGGALLLAKVLGTGNQGWAYLIVAGIGLVLAGVAAAIAGSRLGKCVESLGRTREELTRNIAWIRTVLAYSGRPAHRTKP